MKSSVLSLRIVLLLLGCAFFVTACLPFVGDGSDDATPTPDQIPTVIPVDRPATDASASPVPTLQPVPTRQPQATSPPPSCTPRNDWPIYTIQAGDTLYSIAQRTDTTVDAIVAANCLGDANVIRTNQELRVPQLPGSGEAATPAPSATQRPFLEGTATPGGTAPAGSVEFVVVAKEGTKVSSNTFQALSSNGEVTLAISVSNVARIQIVRSDGQILDEASATSGTTTAGGNFTFSTLDRVSAAGNLIFTIKGIRPDNIVEESDPISIRWP